MTDADRAPLAERVQALLALLPALVLAWPFGGPLEHDFTPRATGFGLAALLALPGVLFFLARRAAPAVRGSLLLVVPLFASALWLALASPADPFEAQRATLGWTLVLASFLLGAVSDPRTLARGTVFVALLAAASGAGAPHAGALGNAGATAEVATLGAGAACVLVLADGVAGRILGAAALVACAHHVARAPVLAGGIALAAAAWLGGLAASGRRRVGAGILVVLAGLTILAPVLLHRATRHTTADAVSTVDTSPASGISVRLAVHAASARLLAAHALAGVGPGQFPAAFPPFRDPAEIEASTHGRLQAQETEVEHAHDDWIQPALELGLVVGLAWVAFLVLLLRASWQALRSGDVHRAALAAGLVALLVHALARAPITSNAASATLFAAAAGSLLARRESAPATAARRISAIAAMLLFLAFAPRAWSFVRHGFALRPLVAAAIDDPEGRERAIARAAALEPDSVLVRTLEARLAEALGDPPAALAARWDAVLALRPHRVEALVQKASASARAGDRAGARATLERALQVDPGNPPALTNLAALELHAGELAAGLARLDRIPATRAPDVDWLRGLAARLALAGLEAESSRITARAEPDRAALTPEERYALSRELRTAGEDLTADGWEARAHRAWAAEHAALGRWNECLRSVRQDLRLCLERPGAEPLRVRLALAAALARAGRHDEARAGFDALASAASAADRAALPEWTRAPLAELGFR